LCSVAIDCHCEVCGGRQLTQECFSAPCQLRHNEFWGVQRLATHPSGDAGLLQVAKHVGVKIVLFARDPKCFLITMDLGLFPRAFALASVGCARMLPQALARKYLALADGRLVARRVSSRAVPRGRACPNEGIGQTCFCGGQTSRGVGKCLHRCTQYFQRLGQ